MQSFVDLSAIFLDRYEVFFVEALLASGMLQALVFLHGFKDLFLIKSQDVILHSLPDGLTGLNVIEVALSSITSLYNSFLLLYYFHPGQ